MTDTPKKPGRPRINEYRLLVGFTNDHKAWLDSQRQVGVPASVAIRRLIDNEIREDDR